MLFGIYFPLHVPVRLVTSVEWQPLPEKPTEPSLSQPKHLSLGVSPQLVPSVNNFCKQFQYGVCPPLPQAVPESSKPQGKKPKKVLTRQVPGNPRDAIYIHEAVKAAFELQNPSWETSMSNLVVSLWLLLVSVQERLREAAKQQIRRWIAPHRKKKNLEAPDFVKQQWVQNDQNGMSQLLMDCNFQKEQSRSLILIDFLSCCPTSDICWKQGMWNQQTTLFTLGQSGNRSIPSRNKTFQSCSGPIRGKAGDYRSQEKDVDGLDR